MPDEINSELSTPSTDLESSFTGANVEKNVANFQGTNPPGLPPEPFAFVSDVPLGSGTEDVGSVNTQSYAIEYSAINGRNEIRNLLADTFQINNNNNDEPSPGPTFPVPEEVNSNEFFSTDIRPVIASSVTQERSDVGIGTTNLNYGSTIDTYTSVLSRPDLWRPTDGGMFEVAGINDLKHYSYLSPQETRMAEVNWPGTQVGIATGIISKNDPTKITNVVVSFSGQPTTCNGVSPGYTVVYEGDLVHDDDKAATATNGYLQRNTRVKIKDGTTYTLNKSHTYTGTVGIAHTFKVRRIGPSKITREYGYYGYHYYRSEGSGPSSPEDFKLTKEYTSEYSYAYYYGKKPDGLSKTGSSALGAAGVDGNTSRYTAYNITGRWGVYIDAEVKNYFEGRTFIGHNQGIGVGAATSTINGNANTKVQPDPILSVFNNRFKNQRGELDVGSNSCPGTLVGSHGDYSFDQYQMGLYVEDVAAIGTRPDIRYRLSVDGTPTGAGILGKFTGITSTSAAYFKGKVVIDGPLTVTGISTGEGFFPSGTTLVFYQAAAPTGWTKLTTQDNKALRVVSGTGGGSGGTNSFTSAFNSNKTVSISISISGTTGDRSLTTAQLSTHGHNANGYYGHDLIGSSYSHSLGAGQWNFTNMAAIQQQGLGDPHNHSFSGSDTDTDTFNLDVQYIDVIICSKN